MEALQRKALESESKLKKQQAMYESVRSDRNMYSKNLLELQDEIEIMNRSFRALSHQVPFLWFIVHYRELMATPFMCVYFYFYVHVCAQVDQYKEEITMKDHCLVKEHFDHHTVDKQKDALKGELLRVKRQIHSSKQVSCACFNDLKVISSRRCAETPVTPADVLDHVLRRCRSLKHRVKK